MLVHFLDAPLPPYWSSPVHKYITYLLISWGTVHTRLDLAVSNSSYITKPVPNRFHFRTHLLSHLDGILQWLYNSVIPVHWYTAQMQYTRWRQVHIGRVPQVTDDWTKYPLVVKLHAEVEWHYHHRDEDVGEGKGDDEVVGDNAKFSEKLCGVIAIWKPSESSVDDDS